ncbi:MAG: hypothetical protein O2890_14585 [Cyanobacteria bacterium]|nr:hypothetical protein [Cyanobacteriota bacterium]
MKTTAPAHLRALMVQNAIALQSLQTLTFDQYLHYHDGVIH